MDITTFRKLFVYNDSSYGEQKSNSREYVKVAEKLTDDKIKSHLDGINTVGLYQVLEGKTKWACVDIDVKKEYWDIPNFNYKKTWEDRVVLQAAKWKEVFEKYGITSYFEDSGNKGAHLWIFFKEPVPAEPVKNALETLSEEVVKVHEGLEWELYPKQPNANFGNLLKGPNGFHQAGKRFSYFIDTIKTDSIKYVEFDTIISLSGALSAIFNNCHALDNMVQDGLTARHLGHDERLQLAYIFGNLGTAGKAYIKNKVFRYMSDWDEYVTDKNLNRIEGKYKPVTCATLQKKGICPGPCDKIKNGTSPITFYYRSLGNQEYINKELSTNNEETESSQFVLDPLDKFYEKEGAYFEITGKGKNEETHWKISNFVIKIDEDLTVYDDVADERTFKGRIILDRDSGGKEYPFEISADAWADSAQVKKMIYRAAGIGNAVFDNAGKIVKCVDKQAAPISKKCSKKIGYYDEEEDGVLRFYMPSVIVSKDEIKFNDVMPIRFTGEKARELNSLDFKLISRDRFDFLTDHIREHLLKLTDPDIMLSLLGVTVLPYSFRFFPIYNKFYLLLKGESGLGKSFLLHAIQRFYCQFDAEPATLSWNSTPYSIQKSAFYYKDVLCVIDDFKKGNLEKDMSKAITLLQGYADNAGRGRLRSDMSTNMTFYPRGIVALSGEDKIEGEASTAARGILIEYPRKKNHNTKDGDQVKKVWDDYAGVTPYLIQDFLKKADKNPNLFDNTFETLRDRYNIVAAGQLNGSRIAQNFAVLATAVKMLVIPWIYKTDDEDQINKIFSKYEKFIIKTLTYNINNVSEESSSNLFWNSFLELLSGQKLRIQQSSRELPGESSERGIPIGYYMDGKKEIAINWGLVFDEISKHLRSTGVSFSHSKSTVLQELYSKGLVLDEKTTPRTMNKISVRVVRIKAELINKDGN